MIFNSSCDKPEKFAIILSLSFRVFSKKFNSIFDIIPEKLKIPKLVQNLANKRQIARQNHEWDLSDELREEIKALGWIVEDTKTGQKCKPI